MNDQNQPQSPRNSTESIGDIFSGYQLKNQPNLTGEFSRYNSVDINSCRNGGRKPTKADLPDWLQPVVQSDRHAIRYAQLLAEAPLELKALAEYVRKNAKISVYNLMNKCCSHANWPATLEKWKRSIRVEPLFEEIVRRLGITRSSCHKAIYKAVWRFGEHALRCAITASEIGRDKFKLFCWIVWKGGSA